MSGLFRTARNCRELLAASCLLPLYSKGMAACQPNIVEIRFGQPNAASIIVLLAIVVAGLMSLVRQAVAQDAKPQANDVQSLEVKFRSQRSAAESAGWLKKFSPELVEQADQLAQKGKKALAG